MASTAAATYSIPTMALYIAASFTWRTTVRFSWCAALSAFHCWGDRKPGIGKAELLDLHADTVPSRPSGNLPVHPYSLGMPDEIPFRDESHQRKPAVRAVVAIVTHEEIVALGHDGVVIRGIPLGREHDDMCGRAEAFALEFRTIEAVAIRINAVGFDRDLFPVDGEPVIANQD